LARQKQRSICFCLLFSLPLSFEQAKERGMRDSIKKKNDKRQDKT
jgi:hypothetical protein